MVFFSAVFAARAPAMGNSADRAWQLSQLVEGVSTAFNPSHGSLSCVKTNSVSFASVQARKLNHYAASPLPTKPSGFAGVPRRASEKNAPWAALAGCIMPPNLFGHTTSSLHVR